jgi:hypothetical protein
MKQVITILTFCFFQLSGISAQEKTIKDTISSYFQEIKLNTRLHKDLWGNDLFGPILIVNPYSRQVYANYPDLEGVLKQENEIFTGTLPNGVLVGNTAIDWNGRRWAMILLPFISKDLYDRLNLFSHELFHLSQPALGFDLKKMLSQLPPEFDLQNIGNDHLEKKDGRIYLRLELEALQKAINSKKAGEANEHIKNALIFRKYRYMIFPYARISENFVELNEGLANYTGLSMCGKNSLEIVTKLEKSLLEFKQYPTFTNTFAYMTIPFYGFILSKKEKYWNKKIESNTNLTDFFINSFNISLPDSVAKDISTISKEYNGERIIQEESIREQAIRDRVAMYKGKFIESPHLEIPLESKRFSYDTRNTTSLDEYGTVYQIMTVSGSWGLLTVTGGALVAKERDRVTVSIPTSFNNETVAGDGWTLKLNKGFIFEKDSIGGNYFLSKE